LNVSLGCCQYEDIISSFKIVSKLLECRKDLIKFERNINLRGDSESVLMLLNEEAGKSIVSYSLRYYCNPNKGAMTCALNRRLS